MHDSNNSPDFAPDDSPVDRGDFAVLAVIHDDADPLAGFAHALRIVCAARGSLEVVDLRRNHRHHDGAGVRSVLEQWKMIAPGASREDVGRLGIKVKKTVKQGDSRRELDRELGHGTHDLLVIGAARHHVLDVLFGRDLTDYLAGSFRQTTLYLPEECRPFVDPHTGSVSLSRILVPVAGDPGAAPAVAALRKLLGFFPAERPTVLGVHLGDSFPSIDPALTGGLDWQTRTVVRGAEAVAHQLAQVADEELADLVIMATKGRETLGEKILGSVTEQLLRRAPCPVLAVAV